MAAQLISELIALFPRVGHDRHDTAAVRDNVMQLLVGTDLAIGNIEEVIPSGDATECRPRLNVSSVVGSVARIRLVVDRHRTIGGDSQAVNQLLQIWPMILAMALGEKEAVSGGAGYASVSFDRCRIVVHPVQADPFDSNGLYPRFRGQRSHVGQIEFVQCSAKAIIIEQPVAGAVTRNYSWSELGRPVLKLIHRLSTAGDVKDHEHQCVNGGDLLIAVHW